MHRPTSIATRIGSLLRGLLLALCLPAFAAHGETGDEGIRIKAAYVLNFLRYTHWPDDWAYAGGVNKEDGDAAEYVVLVIGSNAFAEALRTIADQAEQLGQRRVRVHRMAPAEAHMHRFAANDATPHAIYIEGTPARTLIDHFNGLPVLTIGDGSDFAVAGGMLGLVPAGKRIVFEANPEAIRNSGLQLSAKVLKLARIVELRR